jgi:ComF family protein
LPLPSAAPACGACLQHPPAFASACAALAYAAPVDRLLTRFKFHAGLAEGRLLAELLAARIPSELLVGIDGVVPMPLHRTRLGQRGYNQALELARPLAKAWQLPLNAPLLKRIRATAAQSDLDAVARRRNVRGAFSAPVQVSGRCLLLLDDVVTTGATINEAATTLLAAGAAEVRVLAVARAARPGNR